MAGVHVPITPFREVVGRAAIIAPLQKGPTGLNVGVSDGFTVTVTVNVLVHWLGAVPELAVTE